MPRLINHAPFPNFRYYSSDNTGKEFGVVIVKGTYEFAPSGRLLLAEEQAALVFTDLCHGAVNVTSLRHPSDLVPNKPTTDIIVNAVAWAPGGEPTPSWICGLHIVAQDGGTVVEKSLRVTGPRQWVPLWKRQLSDHETREWRKHRRWFKGWQLSEPTPISHLPLHYEYAYGGSRPVGEQGDGELVFEFDPHNPLGQGGLAEWLSNPTEPHKAPQIEAVDDPIDAPYKAYKPQSLGPIPPAWEPRLPLGGTYDEEWENSIWPDWPSDYRFSYNNSAHPDLICAGFINGDEHITLTNLIADEPNAAFDLPADRIVVDFIKPDGTRDQRQMPLDTVFLDIAATKRHKRHVFLTWRLNFEPDAYESIRIVLKRRNEPENAAQRHFQERKLKQRSMA
ncbi:DUF2169 family type VI secretion system accessory protein [Labrys sp. 22185]|uniref:DUF2169 family type VI secretion system accessory protein n=1 Tax=Labrys sp. 22185 TaxID=3453888 RepID=UPI003F860E45